MPNDTIGGGPKKVLYVLKTATRIGLENVLLKSFDIAPGSVMAYFPEANVLIGTAVDARSKTPAFRSTPVWFMAPASGG